MSRYVAEEVLVYERSPHPNDSIACPPELRKLMEEWASKTAIQWAVEAAQEQPEPTES